MSVVGGAFREAAMFGATGGAALGLATWIIPFLTADDSGSVLGSPSTFIGVLSNTALVALVGALVGLAVAYPAVLLAAMAADLRGRRVGTVVAFFVTFAGMSVLAPPSEITIWLAAHFVLAAYGAVIAWFRLPHIVGARSRGGAELPVVE